ncbi:MarR family transcriptional regulator [Thiotrichales bacterium 19X7-9]|nr:MarR family transcriptional regulator [Thiotrichales bacterium 19X7-9]
MNINDDRQTLFFVMGNLFNKVRNHLDKQFKKLGLNRNEWLIIALLRTNPNGLSQKYVKNYLGIEISYLTKVLNSLEEKALIIREIDVSDRRNRIIKKNSNSDIKLKKIFEIIEHLNETILKDVSNDDLSKVHKLFSLIDINVDKL